ncbi:MAG: putative DNA base hypermodification protein [Gammaproteobacteria bacterium]|nr:putative DNA base hypermodification protein [Gammaproteobacteria bacterium]
MKSPCSTNSQYDLFDSSLNSEYESTLPEEIVISGQRIRTTPVFSAYWYFAAERQRIFFRRLYCHNSDSLTCDAILSDFKFTNAYRASDRVSQYLIRNVIYRDDLPNNDEELFFRIILFKLFNKIQTWEHLQKQFGTITLSNFSYIEYEAALRKLLEQKQRIYSAAYIMPSAKSHFGGSFKHQNHLRLIEFLLKNDFPKKLRDTVSMAEAYNLLLSAPTIGPFLAYQFVVDFNYSTLTNFDESDFVVAGPGALDGIFKCFNIAESLSAEEIIRYMYTNQQLYFSKLSLDFKSLWGRPLQLIDCQNIFCEISKYARIAFPEISGKLQRTRIKQKYSTGKSLPQPWYPPKWKLNEKIAQDSIL